MAAYHVNQPDIGAYKKELHRRCAPYAGHIFISGYFPVSAHSSGTIYRVSTDDASGAFLPPGVNKGSRGVRTKPTARQGVDCWLALHEVLEASNKGLILLHATYRLAVNDILRVRAECDPDWWVNGGRTRYEVKAVASPNFGSPERRGDAFHPDMHIHVGDEELPRMPWGVPKAEYPMESFLRTICASYFDPMFV